jgi:PKD repeat protein
LTVDSSYKHIWHIRLSSIPIRFSASLLFLSFSAALAFGQPTANFSADPTSGTKPLLVDFTDLSVDTLGPINSWSWNFGDGIGTSDVANPSYTYNDTGFFSVSLWVTGPSGTDQEVKVDYIRVDNFGDGGTSFDPDPSHTYTDTGYFDVTLTVTGPGGPDQEVKVDYIRVDEPPPVADFVGDPTSGDKPLLVNFTDQSSGAITGWL